MKFKIRLGCLSFLLLFISCSNKLPYDLQIIVCDTMYTLYDKNGYPVLQEGYYIDGDKRQAKIKKIAQYTENKLGIVVVVILKDGTIRYVAMKPKPEQNYVELEMFYKVYTQDGYEKLKLKDEWTRIQGIVDYAR